MTKTAVWCRHKEDNIIGIGMNIPWYVPSDFKRFRRLTEDQAIVAGQTTYESFPNKTLPNRDIYILSFDENYKVTDPRRHFVLNDFKDVKKLKQDLFISGGASVYKLFMVNGKDLMPDIIVDCEYQGEVNQALVGDKVDITACVEIMKKDYHKISKEYFLDNIKTTVWAKNDAEVDEKAVKRVIDAIEFDN